MTEQRDWARDAERALAAAERELAAQDEGLREALDAHGTDEDRESFAHVTGRPRLAPRKSAALTGAGAFFRG